MEVGTASEYIYPGDFFGRMILSNITVGTWLVRVQLYNASEKAQFTLVYVRQCKRGKYTFHGYVSRRSENVIPLAK